MRKSVRHLWVWARDNLNWWRRVVVIFVSHLRVLRQLVNALIKRCCFFSIGVKPLFVYVKNWWHLFQRRCYYHVCISCMPDTFISLNRSCTCYWLPLHQSLSVGDWVSQWRHWCRARHILPRGTRTCKGHDFIFLYLYTPSLLLSPPSLPLPSSPILLLLPPFFRPQTATFNYDLLYSVASATATEVRAKVSEYSYATPRSWLIVPR